jgi:RimJ/RimL family protein N-acetyltransferase
MAGNKSGFPQIPHSNKQKLKRLGGDPGAGYSDKTSAGIFWSSYGLVGIFAGMEIRLAQLQDVPLIRRLAEEIWWAYYPEIISDEQIRFMLDEWYSIDALSRQITELGHAFWMITPEGFEQPRGYLSISRQEQPGHYYLHKFYIGERGGGLGAQAFQWVMNQYPDWSQIRLNVNRRNFRSVNFYFKMGFRIESIMDLPVGNGRYLMDDFVMVCARNRLLITAQ